VDRIIPIDPARGVVEPVTVTTRLTPIQREDERKERERRREERRKARPEAPPEEPGHIDVRA
jgi:hypothetical protein